MVKLKSKILFYIYLIYTDAVFENMYISNNQGYM